MKCDDVRPLLTAYLDAELPPNESEAVAAHVHGCESCSHELSTIASVGQMLHGLGTETAPSALRELVTNSALPLPPARRQWRLWLPAAAVLVLGALVVLGLFNRMSPSPAESLLAKTEAAVVRAKSLHMRCDWYQKNGSGVFTQREVWMANGVARWQEAGGTVALIEAGNVKTLQAGSGSIPDSAASLGQATSLPVLLEKIVRTNRRDVRLERRDGLRWKGKMYNALVVKDTGKDGSPLRTIFMIDPATSLPAHGEQERQVGGRWKSEGFIHFEFNGPIDSALLHAS